MTSKIVVNNIEADAGVSTVFFNSDIGATDGTLNVDGNLSVDGVITYEDVTNVDSIGIITARSDVSIADKIIHTGDTNTAIRFPAADTFTVETSGAEAIRVSSGGSFGIGTNNPDRMLSVSDTTNGKLARFIGPTNNLFIMNDRSGIIDLNSSGTGDHLCLGTQGDERVRITSAGNVGIGTDNPAHKLDVLSSAFPTARLRSTYTSSSKEYNSLYFGVGNVNQTTQIGHVYDTVTPTNSFFHITPYGQGEGGTFSVLANGNIGIGSDNPRYGLDVYTNNLLVSGSSTGNLILEDRGVGDSDRPFVLLASDGGDFKITSANRNASGTTTGSSEKLRVTGIGSVGIGIANPTELLHLSNSAAGDSVTIRISNTGDSDADTKCSILAQQGVRQGGKIVFGRENSNSWNSAAGYADGFISLNPVDAGTTYERLRLTSDGRLRLATDYISQTTFDNSHAYFDYNPTQTTWGSTGNKDVYMRPALVVRTPVRDSINNPAIVIAENGGQATGRNSLAFFNNDFNSGVGYLKARLYTQVGPSYTGTAFYIDVADSSQNIQNRFSIDVNGNFSGSSSGNISDARLKENIQTIQNPIDKIRGLTGRTFTWTDASTRNDGRTHYGFVAQEVDTVVSELVRHDSGLTWFDADDNIVGEFDENIANSSKTVHEQGVIPILVEALKEALDKIDTLEARITTLEG